VLVAFADLVVIVVARATIRPGVATARRRVGIVLIVRRDLGDALFFDVVGFVADEVRRRVVLLVGFGVLLHGDAVIHRRRRRRRRGRRRCHDGQLDLDRFRRLRFLLGLLLRLLFLAFLNGLRFGLLFGWLLGRSRLVFE
jgi:hypothetical protein